MDVVKLIVGDKELGVLETAVETLHDSSTSAVLYAFTAMYFVTTRPKVTLVSKMLKAIHAQDTKVTAREKPKPW